MTRKERKKALMPPQKIEDVIQWLKQSRKTHDQNILKMLITGYKSWRVKGENLSESKFEKSFKLKPLPMEFTISLLTLDSILDFSKVENDLSVRPFFIEGERTLNNINIRELLNSLLPKNPKTEGNVDDREEKKSLSYVLSRIVIDKIPKVTELSIVNPGLDTLGAAILSLYSISRATNQPISWLFHIWYREVNRVRIESLQTILDSITAQSDADDIETSLKQTYDDIRRFLAQDGEIGFFEDPYSKKINEEWRNIILNANIELAKRKDELKESVSNEIAFLKGFSAPHEEEIDVEGEALTHWPILSLRADGPTAHIHEPLLRNIRNGFNILRYPSIYSLCALLATIENPNRPTANDLENVSDISGRTAFYSMREIEPCLTEQYLPSFKKMGLRYRYIFTPKQRPGVLSEGLIERMILLKKEKRRKNEERRENENLIDTGLDIRGCTVHIEPNWSKGPDLRFYEKGTYEAVVEEETISLNLNHFDRKRGEWSIVIADTNSKTKKRDKGLITRTTASSNNNPITLTERQIELLSFLWSISMSKSQKKWLLDKAGYPQRTANRMLRQMLLNKTLRLLYLPALEFVGLPDGFIAMAQCHDRRSREKLVNFMQQSLPFARVLTGDSNYVVCNARVPAKKSDIIGGNLSEFMEQLSDESFVAPQRLIKSYKMTALYKIRDLKTREWKDPWNRYV